MKIPVYSEKNSGESAKKTDPKSRDKKFLMACVHYTTVAVGSVICGAFLSKDLDKPWILWAFIAWGVFWNLFVLAWKIWKGDFWDQTGKKYVNDDDT